VLQVAAKKLTLKNVSDYIVDIVCKRSKLGYNYGVILIPEGLIDFIPEVLLSSMTLAVLLVTYPSFLLYTEHYCISSFLYLLVIVQVQTLIAELNEILAHDVVDENGVWKKKLTKQSLQLFDLLPQAIQEQLLLERDPHGNVQVFAISFFPIVFLW